MSSGGESAEENSLDQSHHSDAAESVYDDFLNGSVGELRDESQFNTGDLYYEEWFWIWT